MRIAYLDCFAGIAGDMFLGALLDAGVPQEVMDNAVRVLDINASLRVEKVDRSGILSTKVDVLEGSLVAEQALPDQTSGATHTFQPKTQHLHKAGHSHNHGHVDTGHDHHHVHERSLTQIRKIIQSAKLIEAVKERAIRTFELLGSAEAKIHNVPVDEIHFHEVGAVDAIADIVAASAGVHFLNIDVWHCSPINVGSGMVHCAHGTFPVPAPATADLLRDMPTYSAHVEKELVTPTGAAIVRMLNPTFGSQPPMMVRQIGYGAGTRNPEGFANVLRICIGESTSRSTTSTDDRTLSVGTNVAENDAELQSVTVLETALDDLSPQILAHVSDLALSNGALDVMLTPVIMKKGRPGTLLTILCVPADSRKFEDLLLSETSTLGVRIRQDRRICLERNHVTTTTEFGDIRIKIGSRDGMILNIAPEFEDCRACAAKSSVPVKQVQQAALAAYHAASNPQVSLK